MRAVLVSFFIGAAVLYAFAIFGAAGTVKDLVKWMVAPVAVAVLGLHDVLASLSSIEWMLLIVMLLLLEILSILLKILSELRKRP